MSQSRDPRKDPQRGDVIRVRPGWDRHVKWVGTGTGAVVFDSILDGELFFHCRSSLAQWRRAVLPESEVLHVAE